MPVDIPEIFPEYFFPHLAEGGVTGLCQLKHNQEHVRTNNFKGKLTKSVYPGGF